MPREPIPGLAQKIRDRLKKRAGGGAETNRRIDALTVEQIYREAPAHRVEDVVGASPIDRGDVDQWGHYLAVAEKLLSTREITRWVDRLQKVHDLGSGRSPSARR
jgi:hypothetical protein